MSNANTPAKTFPTLTAGDEIRVKGTRLDTRGTVVAVTDGLVCFVGKRGAEHTLVLNTSKTVVTALMGAASKSHRVSSIEVTGCKRASYSHEPTDAPNHVTLRSPTGEFCCSGPVDFIHRVAVASFGEVEARA